MITSLLLIRMNTHNCLALTSYVFSAFLTFPFLHSLLFMPICLIIANAVLVYCTLFTLWSPVHLYIPTPPQLYLALLREEHLVFAVQVGAVVAS